MLWRSGFLAFLPKDKVVVMEHRSHEVEDLITVSVVTFNHAPYIKQCIDSILGQTWQNLEILVVDDCSTDETVDLVKSYRDPRIILIAKKTNRGVSDSTDVYLRRAAGRYIATMCGDDRMATPFKIEKQVEFLKKNEWCSVVFSNIELIGERGEILDTHSSSVKQVLQVYESGIQNQDPKQLLNTFFLKGNVLAGPTMLADMQVFHQYGSFDRRYLPLQDFDMSIRLLINGVGIAVIPEKTVSYRIRDKQMNLSAITMESANRLVYERAKILEQYWKISLQHFKAIFPEYVFSEEENELLVPYYLQDMFSKSHEMFAKLFRVNTLYYLYGKSPEMARIIEDYEGFLPTDFYKLIGTIDFSKISQRRKAKPYLKRLRHSLRASARNFSERILKYF